MAAKGSRPTADDVEENNRSYAENDAQHNPASSNEHGEPTGVNDAETVKRCSPVFNYSTITLTEPMEKLLSRGLNFAVLPQPVLKKIL